MVSLSTIGKYLDQPNFIRQFHKAMPGVLITGAAGFGLVDTFSAPKEERKERFIKNTFVLGATVASALVAVRGLSLGRIKIPGLIEVPETNAVKAIDSFIRSGSGKLKKETADLLEKSKEKVLSLGQIESLTKELGKIKGGKDLLDEIIPPPRDLSAKKIAGEIGRLSLLGAIPVVGGVAGGVAASAVNGKNVKEQAEDKVKEGMFQYLANIVLCNVGAAASLGVMETRPVKDFMKERNINTKFARVTAMIAGIAAVGILGGSVIANFIGNLLFKKEEQNQSQPENSGLYAERHPEALDAALHVDDFATVGVLSGLNWIEPALPIMYSISGYRAGIGYRNGERNGEKKGQRQHKIT